MSPSEFLTWLATSAGASAAFAFIAERIPAWHSLSASAKSYLSLFIPVSLSLLAYAGLTYIPPAALEAARPYFLIVAAGFSAWLASQLAHSADPARIDRAG